MRAAVLTELLGHATEGLSEADPAAWSPAERDDVLAALGPAAIEIVGLAARIRAAKVNGTPVPRPQPARRVEPEPQQPTQPPADDPPPNPPPTDRGRA